MTRKEYLQKAARELGCTFRNTTSVDLGDITLTKVYQWLEDNGFQRSRFNRKNWGNKEVELSLDEMSGFLYFR